ncbi:hypothetical protein TNCV_4075051 [Trichonephila clavipes]|nr:hypothetical protein TNCV_4075051 [Trichonephila clavipes]
MVGSLLVDNGNTLQRAKTKKGTKNYRVKGKSLSNQNRQAKMSCTTKEQMIKSATQVWFQDDKVENMCAVLVESIPRGAQEVISAIGQTSY